jgi:plastocyanin
MSSAIRALTSSRLARLAAATALAVMTVALGTTASGATDKTIRTMGTEDVHINSKIFSNLRFSPGNSTINSGDQITLTHADDTDEPHTLTIVNADELPTDVEDVFTCGEPGTLCDEVFNTVGPQIIDENAAQFINVAGGPGLDGRLDTLFLPPASTISVEVDAPAGTTLSYFCAIHAWMQGTIKVS